MADIKFIDRHVISEYIAQRLSDELPRLRTEYQYALQINSCVLDNVLPDTLANVIYSVFPETKGMRHRRSIRENKFVAAQMDAYNPLLEEAVYAFQSPAVLALISQITGIRSITPDDRLYAGGISTMTRGNFLNPHLDNSHDADRQQYRVINALYYVTPGWCSEYGGNLELWDTGPGGNSREIVSAFNRLVLMSTGRDSWHSVNRVIVDGHRCCVSNYYFSDRPAIGPEYSHVTSFRGRNDEPVKDVILRLDGKARQAVRSVFRDGVAPTTHIYRK